MNEAGRESNTGGRNLPSTAKVSNSLLESVLLELLQQQRVFSKQMTAFAVAVALSAGVTGVGVVAGLWQNAVSQHVRDRNAQMSRLSEGWRNAIGADRRFWFDRYTAFHNEWESKDAIDPIIMLMDAKRCNDPEYIRRNSRVFDFLFAESTQVSQKIPSWDIVVRANTFRSSIVEVLNQLEDVSDQIRSARQDNLTYADNMEKMYGPALEKRKKDFKPLIDQYREASGQLYAWTEFLGDEKQQKQKEAQKQQQNNKP